MKLTLKEKNSLRPLRDLVFFEWIKPELKSGIMLPEKLWSLEGKDGTRMSRIYFGKVLACGPKVAFVKPKDTILLFEYGIKNFEGEWKEGEIYCIEEKQILAKVEDYESVFTTRTDIKKKEEFYSNYEGDKSF